MSPVPAPRWTDAQLEAGSHDQAPLQVTVVDQRGIDPLALAHAIAAAYRAPDGGRLVIRLGEADLPPGTILIDRA